MWKDIIAYVGRWIVWGVILVLILLTIGVWVRFGWLCAVLIWVIGALVYGLSKSVEYER